MPPEQLTPLFKQYWEVKRQYSDVVLMFRLGDFYEMFGEDATRAAPILEITLTSREYVNGERIPMCGVPYHAVERYVARLVAAGLRVALCDQVEDARFAKGLVKRRVTRVVTPGTILEDSMLEARAGNYLAALVASSPDPDAAVFGLAFCDVSTGEFAVTEIGGADVRRRVEEELERVAPRELVLPDVLVEALGTWLGDGRPWTLSPLPAESFPRHSARQALLEHFGTHSLRGFGCEELEQAIRAAHCVLLYLRRRHVEAAGHLRSLATYSADEFMVLDACARRNLELTQTVWEGGRARSLLSIVDATLTPMGGRMLRRWLERPLLDPARINERLDAVAELTVLALLRADLRAALGQVADLERLAGRCAAGAATPRDLGALRNSLRCLPQLRRLAEQARATRTAAVTNRLDLLEDLTGRLEAALEEELPATVRDGGIFRPGYSSHLDDLKAATADGRAWIAGLEASERERTGIASLKVGFNNVFGYYIEVTRPNLSRVPPDYLRKQTTANAERFITPELKEREALILGAEEKIAALEARLFTELRDELGRAAPRLQEVAGAIAELDTLAALAETAVRYGYSRPQVDAGTEIAVTNGRHPVVERLAEEPFVPNDALLDDREHRLLVITGPNMSGKSTYLRQVALIVLLAQAGSFVPADAARIGVVDRIFTRVGAHDDLAGGQSTFMVEMTETAAILNHATERSLVVLDEIGRGTSTFDGLAIAWAVAEFLQQARARTLFATHYHHLNELASRLEGVRNYRAAVKEEGEQVVWLRKIIPGGTDRSYGIHVARLAGLPEVVIRRATEVLADLEAGSTSGPTSAAATRVQERRKKVQLTLFSAEEHPVVEELRGLELTTMTPLEALTHLHRLQLLAESPSP